MGKSPVKSYEKFGNWHKWIVRFAVVVLVVAFFLPEPWNEFTLYAAWAMFGVAMFIWGYVAVVYKQAAYQVLEGGMWMIRAEGEAGGKKAVFVGVLAIIFSILVFLAPGIGLALGILLQTP